uniref:non-specific serine/threonine protein kinase n=1 Tax=Ananas comosus var. bracteatus TaxID=296719 RepID=A0A6V7PBR0_ANACO|nr:unnamed protein product [Ananas comosus var. bracteatus]
MASSNLNSRTHSSPLFCCILFICSFSIIAPHAAPLSFSFNFSDPALTVTDVVRLELAASTNGTIINLTKDVLDDSITNSSGRAIYKDLVPLWDRTTGEAASFTTSFSFVIKPRDALDYNFSGDGLAFFISRYPSELPNFSGGGYLGLFNETNAFNSPGNQLVAVEFDTHRNDWDSNDNHVGVDVNSIKSDSFLNWPESMCNGRKATAWIQYNASTTKLGVFLSYDDNPTFDGSYNLSCSIDLTKLLPEKVVIGFSAATGNYAELHQILSWNFVSTFEPKKDTSSPSPNASPPQPLFAPATHSANEGSKKKSKIAIVAASAASAGVVLFLVGVVWVFLWRKKSTKGKEIKDTAKEEDIQNKEKHEDYDELIDNEIEEGQGPHRYPYSELAAATNNFDEARKLGQGGFGSVYIGFLNNRHVAIKRVSKDSQQGRKEYISEVKIISRLRHRNLMQLEGWCHERGDFLLVYELMPNGSLDFHLHCTRSVLSWPARYNIAQGLASALLYLHKEWEKCVVHRDIKTSNIMLDSSFNSKLGDFGLARVINHDRTSWTTALAGTLGYLAPECADTGKASTQTDIYSFGVVLLEIACGRRPIEPRETPSKVRLVDWVWELYARNAILEAADGRLGGEFELHEMERLMVVGLWCVNPDCTLRPSIKQTISVLQFEAPLPNLPPECRC